MRSNAAEEPTPTERSYSVRDAKVTDFDALVAFTLREAQEAEAYAADEVAVRRGIAAAFDELPPPSAYWVAEFDGQVVASVSVVREWSNFRGGHYWWIQSIFILPTHRGGGVLEMLIDHVAVAARDAGALDLRLCAHESNARALQAYRRCGFAATPYVVMRLDLSPS